MERIAELKIDLRTLDKTRLRKLEKLNTFIELLDSWILSPDRELLSHLVDYTDILHQIQPFKHTRLWRGFYNNGYQDSMGLVEKMLIWNKVKRFKVGDMFIYSNQAPLSFTTDIRIARGFGSTIVSIDSTRLNNNFIWVSDELSYLVCQRRNITPVTQKEVIVLPGNDLTITIDEKR